MLTVSNVIKDRDVISIMITASYPSVIKKNNLI